MGGVVVDPDAKAAFGVGDGAVPCVLYQEGDICEGGVRDRVQNGSGDRSGLSKTGLGEEPDKQKKNDLSQSGNWVAFFKFEIRQTFGRQVRTGPRPVIKQILSSAI